MLASLLFTAKATFCDHIDYLVNAFGDQIHFNKEVIILDSRQGRSNNMRTLKETLCKLAEPLRVSIAKTKA